MSSRLLQRVNVRKKLNDVYYFSPLNINYTVLLNNVEKIQKEK